MFMFGVVPVLFSANTGIFESVVLLLIELLLDCVDIQILLTVVYEVLIHVCLLLWTQLSFFSFLVGPLWLLYTRSWRENDH